MRKENANNSGDVTAATSEKGADNVYVPGASKVLKPKSIVYIM